MSFQVEGDVMLAHLFGGSGEDVWVTTNGTSWNFTGLGGEGIWTLARLGSGGLFFRDFDLAQGGMAASTDLQGWEPVDPGSLALDFGDGAGRRSGFSAGNTFFYIHAGSGRQMYVLKLQN